MAVLLNWIIPSEAAAASGSSSGGLVDLSVNPQGHQLYLDASVNEQHVTSAQVTEHQVEQGANITDHIRAMPKKITIEGIVSNTPIGVPSTYMDGVTAQQKQTELAGSTVAGNSPRVKYTALQFQGEVDRVKIVYPDLVAAALNGYLFTVTTSLATYTNMAIVNLAVPRNVQEANHLHFTIDMQEIRIVQAKTTTISVAPKTASVSKGKKTPKTLDADRDAEKISFYKAITGAAGGAK